MELIALALTALCCFFGSVVVVLAAVLWIRHAQARDEAAAKSEGTASTPASVSDTPVVEGSPFPAAESAHLGEPVPVSPLAPHGATIGDEVEDFDEDGPTTLVDTSKHRPPSSRTPNLQSTFDAGLAPTERISVPRRPTDGAAAPSRIDHVPAPDEPPPLPRSHAPAAAPPSSRRAEVDPAGILDTAALQPGATIIPPEDWVDDHIDDEDVDETMLMARPPLPPKK